VLNGWEAYLSQRDRALTDRERRREEVKSGERRKSTGAVSFNRWNILG